MPPSPLGTWTPGFRCPAPCRAAPVFLHVDRHRERERAQSVTATYSAQLALEIELAARQTKLCPPFERKACCLSSLVFHQRKVSVVIKKLNDYFCLVYYM
jgi:hypothetical protein